MTASGGEVAENGEKMDMNEWADLHGEWDAEKEPRHGKGAVWCQLCECWVEREDMKEWSADGSVIHFLCPGCDDDLLPVERVEE